MLRIKNQIVCVFSIGEISDFITPENLISFELYESAGNLRPLFKMKFTLTDKSVLNYLNAGNILSINFGKDEPGQDVLQFELVGDDVNQNFTLGSDVSITAALSVPAFSSMVKNVNYGELTSLEVMKKIAENANFKFVTNIDKTNDKQVWHQCGLTDWQYIKELWFHSFIDQSTFISFAFDCNTFYFYDIRKLIQEDVKWQFSTKQATDNTSNIINFGQYKTENLYGELGDLVGKNIVNSTFNVTTGEFKESTYKLKNFTAMDTTKLNVSNSNAKTYTYSMISGDVHENYVTAENQNVRNNIMFSSYCIYIPTVTPFGRLKLLDTATIKTYPMDERVMGTSIITSICYQYVDRRLLTNITLNKEAPSGLRGDDLADG